MTAIMAVMMLLSGTDTDNQKAKNQQTQPAQITYDELTPEAMADCESACHQVAVLDGIDSAESLCGAYGTQHPIYPYSFIYEKCAKPEIIEEATYKAYKIVNDFRGPLDAKVNNEFKSRETFCDSEVYSMVDDILHSRVMDRGLDMSFARRNRSNDKCLRTEERFLRPTTVSAQLDAYGRELRDALLFLKSAINKSSDYWMGRHQCERLLKNNKDCSYVASPTCSTLPFCEANKDFPDCDKFLDIYGNCEKILAKEEL